jgi:hypothetical protein
VLFRSLSSENYHRQPAAAPPATRRPQAALHSSRAISHLEVHVPQTPWGGVPFKAASGGDPLLLLPLQLFTSHDRRYRNRLSSGHSPLVQNREREVSRVNQSIHKHTTISILQCIRLQSLYNNHPSQGLPTMLHMVQPS